ncbi:hypothetical protein D3C72_2152490 [compost metagenome]
MLQRISGNLQGPRVTARVDVPHQGGHQYFIGLAGAIGQDGINVRVQLGQHGALEPCLFLGALHILEALFEFV